MGLSVDLDNLGGSGGGAVDSVNGQTGAVTVVTANGSVGTHSDVDISTNPPTDGQVLGWNDANSMFEPSNQSGSVDYPIIKESDKYYLEDGVDKFELFPNALEYTFGSSNLFEGATIINDFFWTTNNGNQFAGAGWISTGEINIEPSTVYTVTGQNTRHDWCQYTSGNVYLGTASKNTLGNGDLEVTTSADAAYVKLNIADATNDDSVLSTLVITGGSAELPIVSTKIKSSYIPNGVGSDQSTNTDSDVEFNSVTTNALSIDGSIWDETGTAPIPIGQMYLFDNGTQYEVRVRKT